MRVIADDGLHGGEVIEKWLTSINDRDAVIVLLERKTGNAHRQEIPGLNDALAHAPSGIPVVMLGWLSPTMPKYAEDPRWHAVLGYPNVVFRRLPEGLEGIAAALEEATEQKRPADPLAIALLTAKTVEREIGILQHDLHHAEKVGGERMAQWEEHARKLFGDKTQAEFIEAVRSRRDENTAGQFAGQTFPDVCVDVEGTLFTSDGAFRENTFSRAQKLASREKRPITVWTGGSIETARTMIRKAGIPCKLVSKQLLRGATVGVVVDDLPHEVFSKEYGIDSADYEQV